VHGGERAAAATTSFFLWSLCWNEQLPCGSDGETPLKMLRSDKVQRRCGGGAAEVRRRCGGGAAEVHLQVTPKSDAAIGAAGCAPQLARHWQSSSVRARTRMTHGGAHLLRCRRPFPCARSIASRTSAGKHDEGPRRVHVVSRTFVAPSTTQTESFDNNATCSASVGMKRLGREGGCREGANLAVMEKFDSLRRVPVTRINQKGAKRNSRENAQHRGDKSAN
jgi:hypothetical protein